jgi:GTP-binding protein EngB required for normal cell division
VSLFRYCIACEGDRPTQGFAEEFFSNIDKITGEIPVLIIFTKFDKLVDQHQSIIGRQNQDWPYAKTKQYAEGEALKDFEAKYRRQVISKLKNAKKKVDWEVVGRLQSPERGGADIGS